MVLYIKNIYSISIIKMSFYGPMARRGMVPTTQAYKRSRRKDRLIPFSKAVKQVVERGKEWKYFDFAYSATTISAGGQIAGVIAGSAASGDGIAQGVDDIQRNGDVIDVKEVHFYGEAIMPFADELSANQPCDDTLRLLLVYDRRPDGAFPGVTDVLQTADINAPLHFDNTRNGGRFRVLHDKCYVARGQAMCSLNPAGTDIVYSCAYGSIPIRIHKKYKQPLRVKYKDNGDGEVDDIDKGNIFALLCSSHGDVQWVGEFRVLYKDV